MVIASTHADARPRPGSEAWSAAMERAVGELALRHRPACGALRVLVGAGATAAEDYLEARATVVLAEGPLFDRRAHARRPLDELGLPTPRRPETAELVLVPHARTERVRELLAAVREALSAGGIVVLAMPASAMPSVTTALANTGLLLVERAPGPSDSVLVVARDPRPEAERPTASIEIDRSTCIDRARVLEATTRAPWEGPREADPAGSVPALLAALAEQLRAGEPDPTSLPWPELPMPSSNTGAPGCDVLAVMPHPDDESIYAGGTIAGLSTAGQRVHLLTVTDGAGGRGGSDLGLRRCQELHAAAEILGIRSVRLLGWSDFGKYRDAARTEPVTSGDTLRTWGLDSALLELVTELRRERPTRVLGLDPFVDPNLSLHGHHLGLGLLLTVAVHAAADPDFAPEAGPAWTIDEHRVLAPSFHAPWSEPFEIDREVKRRALVAHRTQAYSTTRLLDALADPGRPAVEHTRRLQGKGTEPWLLVRPSAGAPLDAGIDWRAEADRVASLPRPRRQLVELLRRQAGPSPSPAIEHSLQMLARDGSVAVVTGQQVGLLGGPVYTLAKALSAVALARRLQRDGIEAVPVFWLASQDHDLDEVQRVPRLDAPTLKLSLPDDGHPVGRRALGPTIEALWRRFADELPTRHDTALIDRLRSEITPESTFASAFVSVLREATRGSGLLVLDPDDESFARLARPLLHRAGIEAAAVDDALRRARARLRAAGRREVIATEHQASQLFVVGDDGVRRRLGRDELDARALDELLERDPRRVSGAALLRPVVQDFVLPTIAYVGGPTERRYLEQTDELHAWAGVPHPRTVARASLLPIDASDGRALDRAGGVDSLRVVARPLDRIGRAGLHPRAVAWLDRIEATIASLGGPEIGRAAAHVVESLEPDAATVASLPRLQTTWPQWRQTLARRADALAAARRPTPRRRDRARLRGELLRLRRAVLRDGRRMARPAVDAWRRVGSVPAPPERRTTVVELLARGGPSLCSSLLAALETGLSPELTLWIGDPT